MSGQNVQELTGTASDNRGALITRVAQWQNAYHVCFLHRRDDYGPAAKDIAARLEAASVTFRMQNQCRFLFPDGGQLDLHVCRSGNDFCRFGGCQWQTLFVEYAPALQDRAFNFLFSRLRKGPALGMPEPLALVCYPSRTLSQIMNTQRIDATTPVALLALDNHPRRDEYEAARLKATGTMEEDNAARLAKMAEAFPVLEVCHPFGRPKPPQRPVDT